MHDHDQERTILVLNSGSSSLKFGLFAHSANDETLLLEGAAASGRELTRLTEVSPGGRRSGQRLR
ncbi:acetate kinase [Paraburkholderia sp. MM5384-R2]|nr:acetate kinase [Paraburkholderia sp. MM5384-R2]